MAASREDVFTDDADHLRAEIASLTHELMRARRTLDGSQRLAQIGSWEWDLRTDEVFWSDEMYRLHGYEPGEIVPDRLTALSHTHPDDRERRERWFDDLHANPGTELEQLLRVMLPDGGTRRTFARAVVELDESGERWRYTGTVQDRSADAQSDETERLLAQIVTSASDAIYVVDHDMNVLSWNPAAERLYGYTSEEIIGRSVKLLFDDDGEPGRAQSRMARQVRLFSPAASFEEYEALRRRKDGSLIEVSAVTSPLRNEAGDVIGLVAAVRDVSERRRAEAQIAHLASHDALTGLFNRHRFEEELAAAARRAAQSGHEAAVLMLDLDNFKYVNETHGHKTGDELVASIAASLQRHLGETDVLARFGGDEFGVLIAPATSERARELAERLLTAVRDHEMLIGGNPLRVSASIGVATFTGKCATAQELLADVDRAMYRSKEAGRDRVTLHGPQDRASVRTQLSHSSEHMIRNALDRDHFELYVQPIVNLRTGLMTQCEVLLRLNNAGVVVSPGDFLPAAERLGLIHLIDRWVIDRAFALAPQHPGLTFEINLSGATMDDQSLVTYVADRLEDHGTDPRRVVFELTETAAVGNISRARELARSLAELGCTFAIDDFGAGFSTFYYLKHFPAQYVKIDGEFLSDTRNRMDDLVIESIVRIARDLGKQTIAEYVSDAPRMERVRSLGVDYAQGYHFAKPFPASGLSRHPREVFDPDTGKLHPPLLAAG